ncbi:MAG: thioredoxin [Candidatus Kerfeldbacteria bacterium RIFCSPHIGHO2_02_FULL_42_14]|uniref:Thioredoxin n=1 Tax=Candidatus Kerfeldbacteria bacterium RIFCSPHIGHO2_02_FULL_42_14 TaxID=1798540 RepID=A0A1G2AVM9_9BACT|nr:MAG: thioredoxin [Candidatus Kerfeldbacteria bacterium RIFCSPHIGHO2_02_FULL_42_14]OGY81590.1 MAG: thioredoxin [Candidatus Kerfeldbacteria bacterium RIFCSPHIGHO2_12_FULL_42_13]OGY83192.1 MAG: thioredoxin [Candidatus Kerfeldbacteria bacterium RIFCSPLOWO2_02_FULL_42_19]OGY86255.1 MAG: thioredoxin [Candidatus Kerfeldbacteria bacterium RIFCSPLOWO2_12_FULL_43_9]
MSELILTDQNFEKEVIMSQTPVLVDFWAPWCGPCKILGPIVEEVAKEYEGKNIKVGKLNVDENPQTASQFGIMSIPTLLIFKDGKVLEQLIGVQDKSKITESLDASMA